jgi:hypothetical protein
MATGVYVDHDGYAEVKWRKPFSFLLSPEVVANIPENTGEITQSAQIKSTGVNSGASQFGSSYAVQRRIQHPYTLPAYSYLRINNSI